jgi:hypothetical protein
MWHTASTPIWHQISLTKPSAAALQDLSKIIFCIEHKGGKMSVYDFPRHSDEKRLITNADAGKYLSHLKVSEHFPEEYKGFMAGSSQCLYLRIDATTKTVLLANTQ